MRFLQGTDDRFIVLCTDCIVALASDTSLGSVTFITDSCGAVGIIETLCSAVASRLDTESAVCTAMLRCMQLLVHHHVANQCRLCACGGLAVSTQVIVRCNAAQRSCDSVRWAVAIVAHVASSSRAGFDAAMSCGGVDAVFMAGVRHQAHSAQHRHPHRQQVGGPLRRATQGAGQGAAAWSAMEVTPFKAYFASPIFLVARASCSLCRKWLHKKRLRDD